MHPVRLPCVALLATLVLSSLHGQAPDGKYADLPGVHLWYTDSGGSGVPLVLLHAATGSSLVWEYQIPAFTKAGYRVIAYDRRGFGRTTLDPAGPQPGAAADDLQNLMDHLGIQRFHLVSTAAGGFVALDYALSFPQRLRSLVVANSVGGVTDSDFQKLSARLRPPEFAAMPAEVREVGPSYRAANPEGTERWVALEKVNRAPGPPAAPQTMRHQVTFALLETLKVPTLLLTGDADMFAPPSVMKLFADRIKGSQSVTIPEAGHSTYWEKPELFNAAVLKFVRKH